MKEIVSKKFLRSYLRTFADCLDIAQCDNWEISKDESTLAVTITRLDANGNPQCENGDIK